MFQRAVSRHLLLLLIGSLPLQFPDAQVGAATLFPDPAVLTGQAPFDMLRGDFNRDGIEDLAVANRASNDLSILLGDGRGSFASSVRYPAGQLPTDVAQGDLNGDGAVDLAVVNESSDDVSVFLGRGDGTFSAASSVSVGDMPGSVVLDDFSGDAKDDLVVANASSRDLSILVGRGDGTLNPQVRYPLDPGLVPASVVADEFNGDARPDLAVASGPEVTILLGDGTGSFVAGPHLTHPGVFWPHRISVVVGGNLNSDGRTDLAALDDDNGLLIFLGSGDGQFMSAGVWSSPTMGDVETMLLEDVNHDARLDVIRPHKFLRGLPVLLGLGDGRFTAGPVAETWYSRAAAVLDLDRDGHGDLLSASLFSDSASRSFALNVLHGRGDGSFETVAPPVYATGVQPIAAVAGDFSGEGVLDLATLNRGVYSNPLSPGFSILQGLGDGRFGPAQTYSMTLPGYQPTAMATSDLDRDGRADLVLVAAFGSEIIQVLINRGEVFAGALYLGGHTPLGLAVGDVNGDGHDDIVTANGGSEDLSLLLGQGDGTFAPQVRLPLACAPVDLRVEDLNGDAVDDLAVAVSGGGCWGGVILRGVRGGIPVTAGTVTPPHLPKWIVVADFNSDGHPDLLIGGGSRLSTYLGNGDATFAPGASFDVLASVPGQNSIGVSDFNQDGLPDLAIHLDDTRFDIWNGVGDGSFSYLGSFGVHGSLTSLVASDFDADGRPDVALTVSSHDLVAVRLNQGIPNDSDADGVPDEADNCVDLSNPGQENADGDTAGDACDPCPRDPLDDADADGRCADADNCPAVSNTGQEDADFDTFGDACDNCPTVPNVDQSPCACGTCAPIDIFIDFDSPLGRGSGLVSWKTGIEHDIQGFNVVTFDNQGARVQQNQVLILCTECITDQGAPYAVVIPKHRSGRNVFVEQVRRDGRVELFGPAQRR